MAMCVREVLATPELVVSTSDHGAGHPPLAPVEEACDHYSVNFVESGEFGLAVEERFWRLRAGHAFAWHPKTVHRYSHFVDAPGDTCLTIRFRGVLERELERGGHLADAAKSPVLPRSARIWFLRYRLGRLLEAGDVLALGAWAADLIRAATSGSSRDGYVPSARHAPAVEEARRRLVDEFAEPHSLSSLASWARMSPFHFARVFHAMVGMPPHRFLREQRLRRALEMLRDGEPVTTTCYAVGFGNLSHFIHSFRDRFGFLPSRARKNPQAHDRLRL